MGEKQMKKNTTLKTKTERDGQRDDDHCDNCQGVKCPDDWLPAIQGFLEDKNTELSICD